MGTLVSGQVDVGVNVMTQATNFTVNTTLQSLLRIANARRLKSDYFVEKRETIEKGLYVWLAEQTLLELHFEIYVGDVALERFDLQFKYQAQPDCTVRKPDISKIEEFCRRLPSLPSGADCRVVVTTADGASDVPGWSPTDLLPLDISNEFGVSDFGYGTIGTNLVYRGGRW